MAMTRPSAMDVYKGLLNRAHRKGLETEQARQNRFYDFVDQDQSVK